MSTIAMAPAAPGRRTAGGEEQWMSDERGPAQGPRRRIAPHMFWALPKELRVDEAPMELTVPLEPLDSLAAAGNLYLRAKGARAKRANKPEQSVLVDLAIEAWRLRRRIDQARDGLDARAERAFDSSARKLEAVLERARVEVRDPVGSAYSDGMRSVRALAFEP
ncbi:MAG: hypothetical protein OER88_14590, partial [Planctomycetota bacterium]|nr:hypothetical protein [Planctomycetota bacterium]